MHAYLLHEFVITFQLIIITRQVTSDLIIVLIGESSNKVFKISTNGLTKTLLCNIYNEIFCACLILDLIF